MATFAPCYTPIDLSFGYAPTLDYPAFDDCFFTDEAGSLHLHPTLQPDSHSPSFPIAQYSRVAPSCCSSAPRSSSTSIPSASSSRMSSPHENYLPVPQYSDLWLESEFGTDPVISGPQGAYVLDSTSYPDFGFEFAYEEALAVPKVPGFVDPSLINPMPSPVPSSTHQYIDQNNFVRAHPMSPAASPRSTSHQSMHARPSRSESPYEQSLSNMHRMGSPHTSIHSGPSQLAKSTPGSRSTEGEDDTKSKNICPYPDCGRAFKDLKAHMLTHQDERPEKCPIPSCEFFKRGFARKYDRNRHLVTTHYKSTIVCGFCPGSGSAAEKSFNRTDVFKRHLVALHGVEQSAPNGRRKSPGVSATHSPTLAEGTTGKCSTCGGMFASAQDLFEHLDDCVLRVVQQVDPGEAMNEKLLRSVAEDQDVKNTMERHHISDILPSYSFNTQEEDDDFDGVEQSNGNPRSARAGRGAGKATKPSISAATGGVLDGRIAKNTSSKSATAAKSHAGITYSKGGVTLPSGKGQRKKKEYPQSWGCSAEKMRLKKRVLCVFDGQRRLWKDDMMLANDHEVRVRLPDQEAYVTDLDVQTVKRAEAFHDATEEEKGPWVPTNIPDYELEQFLSS